MLGKLLLLLLCGVSCSLTCPDGKMECRDQETCCFTKQGYKCCAYPNAVCCPDQAHCCPSGYMCDQTTQMCVKRWGNWPLLTMEKAPLRVKLAPLQKGQVLPPVDQAPPSVDQAPPPVDQTALSVDQTAPSLVHCDNYFTCPDGCTCCKHPKGGWTCCVYSPGHCCLDGYHCCPYGYDCDYTYTHCIRQGVPHPFSLRRPSTLPANPVDVPQPFGAAGVPAHPAKPTLTALEASDVKDNGVIHCDAQFYCGKGSTCCRKKDKTWSCCPYPLGYCCADGNHCCEYGYSCDPTFKVCRYNGYK